MKIILLSLLTLVLVSCGEIRLEIGGDDLPRGYDEVGTWNWIPEPDRVLSTGDILTSAYLVNTQTGAVQWCKTIKEPWTCALAVDSDYNRRAAESAAKLDF